MLFEKLGLHSVGTGLGGSTDGAQCRETHVRRSWGWERGGAWAEDALPFTWACIGCGRDQCVLRQRRWRALEPDVDHNHQTCMRHGALRNGGAGQELCFRFTLAAMYELQWRRWCQFNRRAVARNPGATANGLRSTWTAAGWPPTSFQKIPELRTERPFYACCVELAWEQQRS